MQFCQLILPHLDWIMFDGNGRSVRWTHFAHVEVKGATWCEIAEERPEQRQGAIAKAAV